MIDYYETKQHPVTKRMVLDVYKKVLKNKGSAGIDGLQLADFKLKASANLYKIWNRMTSGSYYPSAVKQVFTKIAMDIVQTRTLIRLWLSPKEGAVITVGY